LDLTLQCQKTGKMGGKISKNGPAKMGNVGVIFAIICDKTNEKGALALLHRMDGGARLESLFVSAAYFVERVGRLF